MTYIPQNGGMAKVLGVVSDYLPLFVDYLDHGRLDESHIEHVGNLRLCLGDVITVYHTIHTLRDYGWIEHVVTADERRLDLEALYTRLRRLLMVLYHMLRVCQRACEELGCDLSWHGIEDLRDTIEFRWMWKHYSLWSKSVMSSANYLRMTALEWLIERTSSWFTDDLFKLEDAQREMRLTEKMMHLDMLITLHIARPIDMPLAQYPDVRYLSLLEMRMRGDGGECLWPVEHGKFPTVVLKR